ncbi:hypothetical protein MAR_031500 [Mya arenaria]|uniref:Uncharacterized protein n=1 Tax=Mya arenaria TaxID=6604 RepID=A0ABY7F7B3_MYAAR|nr:hypothetical protein MAR_031500 [Mya arenaria]
MDEIWRQAVKYLVGRKIQTEPDVSKSDTDGESDEENLFSNFQPYLKSQTSAGKCKQASPPTTYSEQQWELSDESIERCYQAARDLMQIRMGPFGKQNIASEYKDEPEIEITFKLQFLTTTERLKITITEIKNIGGTHDIEKTSMYVEFFTGKGFH